MLFLRWSCEQGRVQDLYILHFLRFFQETSYLFHGSSAQRVNYSRIIKHHSRTDTKFTESRIPDERTITQNCNSQSYRLTFDAYKLSTGNVLHFPGSNKPLLPKFTKASLREWLDSLSILDPRDSRSFAVTQQSLVSIVSWVWITFITVVKCLYTLFGSLSNYRIMKIGFEFAHF